MIFSNVDSVADQKEQLKSQEKSVQRRKFLSEISFHKQFLSQQRGKKIEFLFAAVTIFGL